MIRGIGWHLSWLPPGLFKHSDGRGAGWLTRFQQFLDREAEPPETIPKVVPPVSPRSAVAGALPAAPMARPLRTASAEVQTVETPPFAPAWVEGVEGRAPDGSVYGYNPKHFATRETAEHFAAQLSGEVIEITLDGPFTRSEPERLIAVGDAKLNAGLVADLYSKYPKEVADRMIAATIDRHSAPEASAGEEAQPS